MEVFIISSNIRFSTHDDGNHAWPLRKNILAQIYQKYSPIVIGTQEGRQPQLEELQEILPGYTLAATHRSWLKERMYPCIFFQQQSVQLHDSGDFWLSLTPYVDGSSSFESMFPRLCTWVCLQFQDTRFFVFNTHLDHVKASTREAQVSVLCQEIKKLNTGNLPVIIMGDFNDSPRSQTRQILHRNFVRLRDDWSGPEEASHHPFSGINPEGQRIDWVLHDFEKKAELHLNKESLDGIWPSDHFPLVAKLRF